MVQFIQKPLQTYYSPSAYIISCIFTMMKRKNSLNNSTVALTVLRIGES
jgi:hypothetical protein